jgi:hypothetical protein
VLAGEVDPAFRSRERIEEADLSGCVESERAALPPIQSPETGQPAADHDDPLSGSAADKPFELRTGHRGSGDCSQNSRRLTYGIRYCNRRKIEPSQVLPDIQVDLWALTTMVNLQLRRYVRVGG